MACFLTCHGVKVQNEHDHKQGSCSDQAEKIQMKTQYKVLTAPNFPFAGCLD